MATHAARTAAVTATESQSVFGGRMSHRPMSSMGSLLSDEELQDVDDEERRKQESQQRYWAAHEPALKAMHVGSLLWCRGSFRRLLFHEEAGRRLLGVDRREE